MNESTKKAFAALEALTSAALETPMRQRFADDPGRFERYSLSIGTFLLDYSKNLIDEAVMRQLLVLAHEAGVEQRRAQMFAGEPINTTEWRPVLHVALRAAPDDVYRVDGKNVVPEVHATLDRMAAFADGVRDGSIAGSGGRFTDVVNIGIGGSDLGPVMATMALKPYHDGPRVHFVSNVDGAQMRDTLENLDPSRTLFLVASKTFTTIETMTNAQHGAGVDCREDRRGQGASALRGAFDRARQGRGVRHRPGARVRVLGLGRRALLGLVGDRPQLDDRDRAGTLPRVSRRRAGDGRAFPHRAARRQHAGDHGADRHLVPQRPRLRDIRRAALRPAPRPASRLPPAARHGEQRQARRSRAATMSTCRPGR